MYRSVLSMLTKEGAKSVDVESIGKKKEKRKKFARDNFAFCLAWDILYMP